MEGMEQRMFSVENNTNEALRIANEALTRVEILDKANDAKFVQLMSQFSEFRTEMKTSLGKLFDRLWIIAGSVIGILLLVSGYLYIESATINKELMKQIISQTMNGTP